MFDQQQDFRDKYVSMAMPIAIGTLWRAVEGEPVPEETKLDVTIGQA